MHHGIGYIIGIIGILVKYKVLCNAELVHWTDHMYNLYHLQMKLRKGNAFTSVCQGFCQRGLWWWCVSQHALEQTALLDRYPLRRPVQRMVRILLECILVYS